jgi:hypothetical protein
MPWRCHSERSEESRIIFLLLNDDRQKTEMFESLAYASHFVAALSLNMTG